MRHGHFDIAARIGGGRQAGSIARACMVNMTRAPALDKHGPVEKPEIRA